MKNHVQRYHLHDYKKANCSGHMYCTTPECGINNENNNDLYLPRTCFAKTKSNVNGWICIKCDNWYRCQTAYDRIKWYDEINYDRILGKQKDLMK